MPRHHTQKVDVFVKSLHGRDVIHYHYKICDDAFACFTLLSEVGEPWQKAAKAKASAVAKRKGASIEFGVTLGQYPWCADILVKKENEK